MELIAGTKLGAYEITSLLGKGGMGEVYKAFDARLGRYVALKVLPEDFAGDAGLLRRFEQEARTVSGLKHPSLVAIYDIGHDRGIHYIAMELIEGRTLRDVLQTGPLPIRKLLPIAVSVAEAIAVAHEAGIVHRDLKPENVMVTAEGLVKILDFGLAKVNTAAQMADMTTAGPHTAAGAIMGTAAYMSPEQAAGNPIDFRSDQFSLGTLLYEMACGVNPFVAETPVQTLSAILEREPVPIGQRRPDVPPPLRWIIERCLSKERGRRYGSTLDLARDLANVREHISEITGPTTVAPMRQSPSRMAVAAAVLVMLALSFLAGRRFTGGRPAASISAVPTFHQLTFRRGYVHSARFAADGRTIVYSAGWDGRPVELYSARADRPESQPLAIEPAGILALSATDELAVALKCSFQIATNECLGTLARTPLSGGGPRELLENVTTADWTSDGKELVVVVRNTPRGNRVEFPQGHVLYETSAGVTTHIRVSPQGDKVAFFEFANGLSGTVKVIDRQGHAKTIASGLKFGSGLAWTPDGREVWFSASDAEPRQRLFAADMDGHERTVYAQTSSLALHDIARDGRVLISQATIRNSVAVRFDGVDDHDLSWFDGSVADALSSDGKTLLFSERLNAGGIGETYTIYLRGTDGSAPRRIGEGYGMALSPDGKWALSKTRPTSGPSTLVLLPAGPGTPRVLDGAGLNNQVQASFIANGSAVVFAAQNGSSAPRTYIQSIDSGPPRLIDHDSGRVWSPLSPDNRFISLHTDGTAWITSTDNSTVTPLPAFSPAERAIGWSNDGGSLFVSSIEGPNLIISRVDPSSGHRTTVAEIKPRDLAGYLGQFVSPLVARDAHVIVSTDYSTIGDLFLVEGLK